MTNKTFFTPAHPQQHSIEIKKSRFIACSCKVSQREQALDYLARIKTEYPDARHYCWAYLLGNPASASSAAMSDDGEPSGTAGKPILNVIQHKKIGDIMVIVVRYFGGIKLGAGGLTRAYSSATEALLSSMELSEFIPQQQCQISMRFAQENQLRHWAGQHQASIASVQYDANSAHVTLELPTAQLTSLQAYCLSLGMTITPTEQE